LPALADRPAMVTLDPLLANVTAMPPGGGRAKGVRGGGHDFD
jgi:hypothetical protein